MPGYQYNEPREEREEPGISGPITFPAFQINKHLVLELIWYPWASRTTGPGYLYGSLVHAIWGIIFYEWEYN